MIKKITLIVLLAIIKTTAQQTPIKIVTEKVTNRLAFYAVNETEQDYDVQLTIKGTNFRQSKARPRFFRVPGASKVRMKTIIPLRGKQPNYTYDLKVNDSLSKRAVKAPFERIKIKPKKSITVYITGSCATCDSIVQPLEESNYLFKSLTLNEHPEVKDQLKRSFSQPLDSIDRPIINLGGRLFTSIGDFDELLEELEKE